MEGLMQEVPLTLDLVLRRLETVGAEVPVASAGADGVVAHFSWGEIGARARRLAAALDGLGVPARGRVATLAWSSHRHLELFYGVPCSDRVLHTLNARLRAEELLEMMRRCEDEVLFVDASLTPLLAPLAAELPVREVVVMEDGPEPAPPFAECARYESLLAAVAPHPQLPPLREQAAVCICHTSGTSGRPKGIVYSNRSVVLHALAVLSLDGHGVHSGETVLPLTPMFHLMAWGLPYSSALAPAPLVLPGADTSPAALAALIESEGVTMAAGVPTLLARLADHLGGDRDLSSLRRVLSGGASAPPSLVDRYLEAGVEFVSSWGMTEAGSGTCQRRLPGESAEPGSGRAIPGMELRIVGEDGGEQPWDGAAVGELEARGPWVARAYLDPEDDSNESRFDDGWLRTGDLATIDSGGGVRVVDRVKDLVKSGGEWISSAELESHLQAQPGVLEAAVIAIADETWGERPLALVVAADGAAIDAEALRTALAERVPRWWIPERIEPVPSLPKTSVGKLDKRRLREDWAA
jgi:fatty-acyl-CoA synthase